MLGLPLALQRNTRWWPDGAMYAADFVNNRYMRGGIAIDRASALTFSRNSPKLAQDSNGIWHHFAANEPAITDRGLLLEPQATNMVPNSSMTGAALGVVGAGGALPAGWTREGYDTVTVTALGDEDGLPYVELRLQCTNSTSAPRYPLIRLMPTAVPALLGETWTASCFFRKIAGQWHPNPISNLALTIAEIGTTTLYPTAQVPSDGMTTQTRMTNTWTLSRTGSITLIFRILQTTLPPGGDVDVSVRVYAPMLAKQTVASSPILTTDTIGSRNADLLLLHLPAATLTLHTTTSIGVVENIGIAGGDYMLTPPLALGIKNLAAD